MTRFALSENYEGLTILHMKDIDATATGAQLKKIIKISGDAVTLARAALDKNAAIAQQCALKYFLVDLNGADGAQHSKHIKTILGKILVGLGQNTTFKIGDNVSKTGNEVIGEVKATYPPNMEKVLQGNTHNKVKDLETGKPASWSIIKLEAKQLMAASQWNKLRILIHENSHKFGGTIDYMYFDNLGQSPRGTFDKPEKALINADSFAWFATTIYKTAVEAALAKKATQ